MAKDIFKFDGSIQFDRGDIDKQIQQISQSIEKSIGQQSIDFKISKDSTSELKNFADSIKNINSDMNLSKLGSELEKISISKDNVSNLQALATAMGELDKTVKPRVGDNLEKMSEGLAKFMGSMKDYSKISEETVTGLDNITKALAEFQSVQSGINALNKLGTAMKKIAGSEDAFSNLTDMGDALGNLQDQIQRYIGTGEALAIPVRFKVEAGDFGKVMEGLETLDLGGQTDKLQSDLNRVQEAVMATAEGFATLGEKSREGLSQTGDTLANAIQLATNLGIIMQETEQAKASAIQVTQDMSGAKGTLIDIQAESIKAQEGSTQLAGQLESVTRKAAQMERAFADGDSGSAQNYFNQLVKGATNFGSTIAEVETAYSRIMDAGGTLTQKQLAELESMKSSYDDWVQRINDVKEGQEVLANTAVNMPPMFKDTDGEQMKIIASTMADIGKDMEQLKAKTSDTSKEFTSLLTVGSEIIRVEENIGKVLANTSIEAKHFREQARGIQEELNQIKGNHFSETFNGLQEVSLKTDESITKFTRLREELRNTEADSRYLTQLHNGVRDLNNELLVVEQTIAKMEKGGGFMAGDIQAMKDKKAALQDLLRDYETMASKQEAFARHTKDGAASLESFDKAVSALNSSFREQGDLTEQFKTAITAYTGLETEITKITESLGNMGQEVYKINGQFHDSEGQLNRVVFEYDSYTGSLIKTKSEVQGLRKETDGLGESFDGLFQHLSATSMVMRGFYQSIGKLKEGISFIGDVNDQLTQLAIVQDKSFHEAAGQLEGMKSSADDLSRSLSEVMDVSVDLARQGLGESQIEERMEAILKLASVARMSVGDATKAITVGVNAMNEEVGRTGDVLLRTSQKAATDVEGLAKGFSVSAASAHALGMSIEETSAMIAVLTERTQLAETRVGNAVKTMLARFNQIKAGDLGKDELNQVQEAIEGIANVDFTKANGEIRSMYDILGDLAEVWDTLDQNQQAAIATAAGGTHMQQFFYALMDGYEDVIALSDDLARSTGDVDRAYEKWMGSSEAATMKLKNAWEQFSLGLINSGSLNFLKDMLAVIIQIADKVGAFSIIAGGAFAALATNTKKSTAALAQQQGILEKLTKSQADYTKLSERLKEAQVTGTQKQVELLTTQIEKAKALGDADKIYLLSSVNLQEKLRFLKEGQIKIGQEMVVLTDAGTASLTRQQIVAESLKLSFAQVGIAIKGAMATLLPLVGITIGISAVSKGISMLVGNIREVREENAKLAHEIQHGTGDSYTQASEQMVNGVQRELVELQKKKDAIGLTNEEMLAYTDLSNQLGEMLPSLVQGEDEHGNKLLDKSRIYGDLNEQIREHNQLQAQQNVKNFRDKDIGGKAFADQAKEVNKAIQAVRDQISSTEGDILRIQDVFGMSLGQMKARMDNTEFALRIQEMSPEQWSQLSTATQARIRDMMYQIEQTGRMTAEQTYHEIMAQLGSVPPEVASLLQSPDMQEMIRHSLLQPEYAGMSGHEAAEAFVNSFAETVVNNDTGLEAMLSRYAELGTEIAEIQEQVREGEVEAADVEAAYLELKEERLEIMGELAELSDDVVEGLLEQVDSADLLRDIIYDIRDAQEETAQITQEDLVDNFQDLRSELEELNQLSIDLANAGDEWGVTMADAMNNVIAKFPEMAALYGDQEAMLEALSNTHTDVANHYIEALMHMMLGEQTHLKLKGDAWNAMVQIMAKGINKNLEDDSEWAVLKDELHTILINELAGKWAEFYEIAADGTLVLTEAGQARKNYLQAEKNSMERERSAALRKYLDLSASGADAEKIYTAEKEFMVANQAYNDASSNLHQFNMETQRLDSEITGISGKLDGFKVGLSELGTAGINTGGVLNNVGGIGQKAADKLEKGGKKAGKGGKSAGKGGKKAAEGAKKAKKATDAYSDAIDKNNESIEKAKKKIDELREAQEKVKNEIKQTEDAMRQLEKQYDQYNKSLEWTYGYLVKIYEQQKKDLLDAENSRYAREKSLLEKGTDPDARDPFKVVNADNVKDNIEAINKAYSEMSDEIAKKREKEDEARQKAWDDELKAIEKANKAKTDALAKEIEAVQKLRDLEEYRKNLQEKQKNIGKLAARVEDLGLDDSLHGKSEQIKAQEELQQAQKDYVDYIADREFQNVLDLYNNKMQLLEQENQYRYQAAMEELELRKKTILEEVAERRKEEDRLRAEARDADIQAQQRRLELQEILHREEIKRIEKEYSQKEIYLKANQALALGHIEEINGETKKLYDAIMDYRKKYEDGWSTFQHKREEETKNHLKVTKEALDKLGLDTQGHIKQWGVESDKTYQKLKKNLDALNKQHQALVDRQKAVNNQIKALQDANKDLKKAQDGIKKSANDANAAVNKARSNAAGLASNLSRLNNEFQSARAAGRRMQNDIIKQTHANVGLREQQKKLHDQNEIERRKLEEEKKKKKQLDIAKAQAKRGDVAATGRQGGNFGIQIHSKYADGGVVTHTGPAIVHGSKAAPEYVFNTPQMKALADLIAGRSSGRGSMRNVVPRGQGAGIYAENFIKIDGNADAATVRQLKSTGQDMLQKFEQVMRSQGKGLTK